MTESATEFAELLAKIGGMFEDRRVAADGSPVRPARLRELVESFVEAPLSAAGVGLRAAFQEALERIAPGMANTARRDFSLVVGGATPAAQVGDILTTLWDPCVILHHHDSLAPRIEDQTGQLLLDLFDLPRGEFVPTFTSGASASNLVALACARQWWARRQGHNIAEDGWGALPRPVVLSGAAHSSIRKALSELGMGRTSLRAVRSLAGRTAVDPEALEAALRDHRATSDAPAIVVANCGEVNTGDFDDLVTLAGLCRAYGAWLHVDAAFGIFARCSPGYAALARGAELADSIACDLHKLLNVPYDSGLAVLATRHQELYAEVFSAVAPYLGAPTSPAATEIHPMNRRVENSSRFRALPAWMTLKAYGRDGYRHFVERIAEHARRLGARLEGSRDFKVVTRPIFNILLLQGLDRHGRPLTSNEDNQRLLASINATGKISLTAGAYQGQPAIRVAFAKWDTRDEDLEITETALIDGMKSFQAA